VNGTALAPATVSYHLSVLHGSGLVAKSRDSRSVLYRRTEVGDRMR
jgi:DNA-binding transcriptional ArsR family regulator